MKQKLQGWQFAFDQVLTPWPEVTEKWNAQSGETISMARVTQIAYAAHKKLREGLADLEQEFYDK